MRLTGLTGVADSLLDATVVGGFSRVGYSARRLMYGWDDHFPALAGARVLVTGGTSGIGFAATDAFAANGAETVIVGRSPHRLTYAADAVEATTSNRPATIPADLQSLAAAGALAGEAVERLGTIDVLVHNAGALDADYATGPEGFERTFSVHVLAPHVLTCALLPHLSPGAAVITVSSGGMYSRRASEAGRLMTPDDYDGVAAYARAKRAQVMLTAEWARRFPDYWFAAMHPGWADTPGVRTSLPRFRLLTAPILRTAQEGADTVLWLAAERPRPSGAFWHDRRRRGVARLPGSAGTDEDARRLWDEVCDMTGVRPALGGQAGTSARPPS